MIEAMHPSFNICGRLSAFESDYLLPRSELSAFGAPLKDNPQEVKAVSMAGPWTRIEWDKFGLTVTRFNVPLANEFSGIDNRGLANLQHSLRFPIGTSLPTLSAALNVLAEFEGWSRDALQRSFSSRISDADWEISRSVWINRLADAVITDSPWSSAVMDLKMDRVGLTEPILLELGHSNSMTEVEDGLTKLLARFQSGIVQLVPEDLIGPNQGSRNIHHVVSEVLARHVHVSDPPIVETQPTGNDTPKKNKNHRPKKKPLKWLGVPVALILVALVVWGVKTAWNSGGAQVKPLPPTEPSDTISNSPNGTGDLGDIEDSIGVSEPGTPDEDFELPPPIEEESVSIQPVSPSPEPIITPTPPAVSVDEFFNLLKKLEPEPNEWKRIFRALTNVTSNDGSDASMMSFSNECSLNDAELRELWDFISKNEAMFRLTDNKSDVMRFFEASWDSFGIQQADRIGSSEDLQRIGRQLN